MYCTTFTSRPPTLQLTDFDTKTEKIASLAQLVADLEERLGELTASVEALGEKVAALPPVGHKGPLDVQRQQVLRELQDAQQQVSGGSGRSSCCLEGRQQACCTACVSPCMPFPMPSASPSAAALLPPPAAGGRPQHAAGR